MNKGCIGLYWVLTMCFTSQVFSQNLPPLSQLEGVWCSELTSTLEFSLVNLETGEIRGTYTSTVGGGPQSFPLVGWVNSKGPEEGKDHAHVISFAVRWGEIGSITSWTGTYEYNKEGEPILNTIWHLARPSTAYSYEHVVTQSGLFTFGACD